MRLRSAIKVIPLVTLILLLNSCVATGNGPGAYVSFDSGGVKRSVYAWDDTDLYSHAATFRSDEAGCNPYRDWYPYFYFSLDLSYAWLETWTPEGLIRVEFSATESDTHRLNVPLPETCAPYATYLSTATATGRAATAHWQLLDSYYGVVIDEGHAQGLIGTVSTPL